MRQPTSTPSNAIWARSTIRRAMATTVLVCGLVLPSFAFAHGLVPPAPRDQPVARWPEGRPATHDVVVPVLLTISAEGGVTEAAVEASLGPAFDEAAIEASKRWLFTPATSEGKPVAAKIRAVIRFVGEASGSDHGAGPRATAGDTHEQPTHAPAAPLHTHEGAAPHTHDVVVAVGHGEHEHQSQDVVRVTGSRAPPRSASEIVLERAVLRAAPHRTANDLLLAVPGVTLVQHGGEGDASQIFFRGFDAVHGQDLEIWAGGAPVNDVSNIHGQGYADLHFLPPEIVKSVRSTPGAFDPRQGDFAVAGSLHLDLGYDEPGITAKATAGQFGTRRYFLAYRPKGQSDQTFAAFEVYGTDGFGPNRAARRTSGIAQTEYPLGGSAVVRLLASTYATSYLAAGVLRLSDVETRKVDRFATYDPKQGGDATRSQLVVDIRDSSEQERWSLAPYFVLRSMRLRQDFTGYYAQPVSVSLAKASATATKSGNSEQQINDVTTFGLRSHYRTLLGLFDDTDLLEGGVSARFDRIDQSQKRLSISTSEVTVDAVDAKIQATDVAGYLDAALHPIQRVIVRGGVRVDGLSYAIQEVGGLSAGQRRSTQGAHLGKKATVEVRVARGLAALLSYGEGFRSPQARSLQENQTTPFTTVTSYEAGLRYQEGPFRGSAALFRTALSDDLAFDQATARFDRTPGTRRTGLAVELNALPEPWLVTSASVTYTRAEFTKTDGGYNKGDLLPYAPQLTARTDMSFTPVLGHLWNRELRGRLGSGLTFFAKRPLPYGEFGHDVFLLDGGASLRLKEVQLGIDAYNLFNANWFDGEYTYASNFTQGAAPSLVPQRHVTVGSPRTVLATLSLFL